MKNIIAKIGIFFTIIILIAYSVYFNFYGIDLVDSFYNYNGFKNFTIQSASGLVFLTQFAGNAVYHYFGGTLLHYRFINSLVYVTLFLIPIFLVPKGKRNLKYFLLTLLVFVLYSPMIQNILNYDTFSYLNLIILISILISYFNNPSYYKIVILGILSATAIGFRVPNSIVIPLLMLIITLFHYLNSKKINWITLSLYFFTAVISYSIIVLLFFGSFSAYQHSLTSGVSDSGYQMMDLVKSYFNGFLQIALYTTVLLIAFLYYKFKNDFYPNRKIDYFIGSILFIAFYYFVIFNKSFGWQLSLLLSSIFIVTACFYLLYNVNQEKKSNSFQILLFLSFLLLLFVPAAGSNTGLTRCSIMIVFVPYLLVTTKFRWQKNIVYLLLIITPFAIYDRFDKLFYDNHFNQLNHEPRTSVLKHVKTKENMAQLINQVDERVQYYKSNNKEVSFYGFYSHYFNYQYDINYKSNGFRQEITKNNLINLVATNKNKVILFVDIFENNKANLRTLKQTFLNNNFEIIVKDNFCILAPK